MSVWLLRLADGLVWLTLGIIMLAKLRKIVDWVIRQGKKHERRKRTMRAIQKAIYEMDMEELLAERKRLQARAARERGRGSEGVRMISYRLRLIEGRMRQLTEKKGKAPGGAATPSEGRNNDTPVL